MKRCRFAIFAMVLTLLLPSASFAASNRGGVPLPWEWSLANYRTSIELVVGDTRVTAEVSDTSQLRERGLSYHAPLAPDTGMLFIYAEAGPRTFWMKGMGFCLDIIWIEQGQIVGAAESVCPEPGVADADLTRYASPSEVRFVLEMSAGWLADHGYGPGTTVDIPGY